MSSSSHRTKYGCIQFHVHKWCMVHVCAYVNCLLCIGTVTNATLLPGDLNIAVTMDFE